MQVIASNYYGQPYPRYDEILVECDGRKILLKQLAPQQKFNVVYEHSLPHNRPKLKNSTFFPNEEAWVAHIEYRLLRGSHHPDGTAVIPEGLENDPRQSHGTDHGMRVGIFSAVYAGLYCKYDPEVHLTPSDLLAIQLTGAFHDTGRQAEGVDIDDRRSAANAAKDLKRWGFSDFFVKESSKAIAEKDNQKLSTKHVIAKCLQCADSTEYGRVGLFNPAFLDIYKEFNGYTVSPKESWNENIAQKPLREGRTLTEFNQELAELNEEMAKLMNGTKGDRVRAQLSQPGKNYYSEILKAINSLDHPRIYAMLSEMGVIQEPKFLEVVPTFSRQIDQAQAGSKALTTVHSVSEKGELFPDTLTKIKFVSTLGGSTGALKVQDQNGTIYAKKTSEITGNPDHLKAEYHTNKAYQALGVKVPQVALYHATTSNRIKAGEEKITFEGIDGDKPVMLSKFVPETSVDLDLYFKNIREKKDHAVEVKRVQDAAKKGFVADCLLANWDVAGLYFDNMKYDAQTEEIWRIDNGSGLNFRAQGEKKDPKYFTSTIQEFETLRDPKINPNTSFLFKTLTKDEIVQQINDILPNREAFLATIPAHLKEIMGQRFDYLNVYKQKLLRLKSRL